MLVFRPRFRFSVRDLQTIITRLCLYVWIGPVHMLYSADALQEHVRCLESRVAQLQDRLGRRDRGDNLRRTVHQSMSPVSSVGIG